MVKIEPGFEIGNIKVIERERTFSNGDIKWLCLCFCGKHFPVRASVLRAKRPQKSCGCTRESIATLTGKPSEKTRAYKSYKCMLSRCYNPKDKQYHRYGGRGIKVCDFWRQSFQNFFKSMGDRQEGYSIERIDNNGNYEPSNCRWATMKEQHRNTSTCVLIPHRGQTKCLSEWAECLGLNRDLLYSRLKRGWSFEEAITQKSGKERLKLV